ncbi:MAG: DUF2939 domain-containing protein [Alphaproteobacteria bacterium]
MKAWGWFVVLVVAVGAYVAYPYYTLDRISRAFERGDKIALEVLVDWNALRGGLEDEISAVVPSNADNGVEDETMEGGMGALADGFVARYAPSGNWTRPVVEYAFFVTPDTFRVVFRNPRDLLSSTSTAVLKLEGLTWRVVSLRLPSDGQASSTDGVASPAS